MCSIKKGNYVRVLAGLYEGDIGKVTRITKSKMIIAIVPRINITSFELQVIKTTKTEENKKVEENN
jgi:ribosomal protein L24